LNVFEEARAMQAALDAGDAAGPTELARQLGLSQGQVSNRLRLLELPPSVQAKVISREITATQARQLATYAAIPGVCDEVLKRMKNHRAENVTSLADDDFEWMLNNAVHDNTRPTTGKRWCSALGAQAPIFKPVGDQNAALGLVTVRDEGGKPTTVATNVELWEKLQEEHEGKLAAARDKRTERGKPTAADKNQKNKKPLTAAEKKRLAEEDRRREKERAAKLAAGLWSLAIDWRRLLIAKACRERQVGPEDMLRLAVYFAIEGGTCRQSGTIRRRGEAFCEVLRTAGATVKKSSYYYDSLKTWLALATTADDKLYEAVLDAIADLFWDVDDGPNSTIPGFDVLEIAEQLAIDLPAAWKKEAAGVLTERWLNLRNKDDLIALARGYDREYGELDRSSPKSDWVAAMAKDAHYQKPPAELLKPKRPKNRG
jgi:hypothetical protein